MFRKWLKKLIAQAIKENFPPMIIEVTIPEDSDQILSLHSCFFKDSEINISKNLKEKQVLINKCNINHPRGMGFIKIIDSEIDKDVE